jgi:glutaredoxin
MGVSRRSLLGLVLLVLALMALSSWWAGRSQQAVGERAAALAAAGDIRMLSSETCAICTVARRWFTEHRVAFSECMIERDSACRAEFDALGARGTPVLVVRGQPQLGFSPERLIAALQPRG